MKIKRYLVAVIAGSTVLVACAAVFSTTHLTGQTQTQTQSAATERASVALTAPGGKFGPVIEAVLPGPKSETSVEILDLETGHALLQPPWEQFNSHADAIMAWIRSNGLDISCSLWRGGAACVTYDMTVVPVAAKSWEETTEDDLRANPVLAPRRYSPRRLLVLGNNRPDTYIFRTAEGTLGMLRIDGVSQSGQGVKIRYKLINPAKSIAGMSLSDSQAVCVSR